MKETELTQQDATAKNPFLRAYASVPTDEKKRAFIMLAAAGITLAVLLLSRLVWLLRPVFLLVYYGTLAEIIYYIILFVLVIVYSVVLNVFLKKHCGEHIFLPRKDKMKPWQVLSIVAVGAVTVFLAGVAFRFKLKATVEMGSGITMAGALTNIAVYFYYVLHLWLGITAAVLVQRSLTALFPMRFNLPWGAIFMVTVYGLLEFILEAFATNHLYPELYYLFTYAYAFILVISDYRFHISFWSSAIILVL